MTDTRNPTGSAASEPKPRRNKDGSLKPPPTPAVIPASSGGTEGKIMAWLLAMELRGGLGRVIERWPVTSLTELRDAIDAAIEIVNEAEGGDIALEPFDVVLSHFPCGEGKPYRVSFKNHRQPFDEA